MDGGGAERGGGRICLAVKEEEVGELSEGVVVAERIHLAAELGQGEQDLRQKTLYFMRAYWLIFGLLPWRASCCRRRRLVRAGVAPKGAAAVG